MIQVRSRGYDVSDYEGHYLHMKRLVLPVFRITPKFHPTRRSAKVYLVKRRQVPHIIILAETPSIISLLAPYPIRSL